MTTPPSFPTLPGVGFPIKRTRQWSTRVASHSSGREVRQPLYTYPLYQFELTITGLDSLGNAPSLGAQSLQALVGLYDSCQGQAGTFLYTDPEDSSIEGQELGLGDGSTTGFTFVRAYGGFATPVGWVTNVDNVYLDAVVIPQGGFTAPDAPTLSETPGGSLGAQTIYGVVTYVTPSGETVASAEASFSVDANNLLVVASPAASSPVGATAWNFYASHASGAEVLQNVSPIALGTGWTEPTSGLVTGTASPPQSNLTGWSLTTPNTLTFGAAPGAGAAISADFEYAFQCRFLADQQEFDEFMSGLWSVDSLKFRSVKP